MDSKISYKNSFYSEKSQGSRSVITTDVKPLEYKGYLIYKRIFDCFDIVKDGICIGMNAGLNGAKNRIDNL